MSELDRFVFKPYPVRSPYGETWAHYFDVGFCPRCLCRLPYECTYPPDGVDPEGSECCYCGVEWTDAPESP